MSGHGKNSEQCEKSAGGEATKTPAKQVYDLTYASDGGAGDDGKLEPPTPLTDAQRQQLLEALKPTKRKASEFEGEDEDDDDIPIVAHRARKPKIARVIEDDEDEDVTPKVARQPERPKPKPKAKAKAEDDYLEDLDEFIAAPGENQDDDNDNDEVKVAQAEGALGAVVATLRKNVRSRFLGVKKEAGFEYVAAEETLKSIDAKYPVAPDDKRVEHFQAKFRALMQKLCTWGRDKKDHTKWFKLPRSGRCMTRGFRATLREADPEELSNVIFGHMPKKAQQVLGTKELTVTDLLDLPEIPTKTMHRLVYLDVPVRVGTENIITGTSKITGRSQRKRLADGFSGPFEGLEAKVYIGSTSSKNGGHFRIAKHEREINFSATERAMHYSFARHADVAPNFRLVTCHDNPHALAGSAGVSQDINRWVPTFIEGLIMLYLGTYHRSYAGGHENLFPPSSYEFVDTIREGLDLPDFHEQSLNQAWPFVQGVAGGSGWAARCANEACGKWAEKVIIKGSQPNHLVTAKLEHVAGPMSPKYCLACLKALGKGEPLPTREGRPNGCFWRDFYKAANIPSVNEVFFAQGNPRKCSNGSCGVEITKEASIYGQAHAIFCLRCSDFRRKEKREWVGEAIETTKPVNCDDCKEPTTKVHQWDEVSVCDACNTKRCCFDKQGKAGKFTEFNLCANAGCDGDFWKNQHWNNLVEDTERDIWRCLQCDWTFSTYGKEYPFAKDGPIPEAMLPPGPIKHHRFNATECVSCHRFATPNEWTAAEGGGYKCGICHPIVPKPPVKRIRTPKQVKPEEPEEPEETGTAPPRECLNCHKVDTTGKKGVMRRVQDQRGKFRCKLCADYWARCKRERPLQDKKSSN